MWILMFTHSWSSDHSIQIQFQVERWVTFLPNQSSAFSSERGAVKSTYCGQLYSHSLSAVVSLAIFQKQHDNNIFLTWNKEQVYVRRFRFKVPALFLNNQSDPCYLSRSHSKNILDWIIVRLSFRFIDITLYIYINDLFSCIYFFWHFSIV